MPREPRRTVTRRLPKRLPHAVYGMPGLTFHWTICTDGRRRLFEQRDVAQLIASSIHERIGKTTELLAFVVMPDHVHLLTTVREINAADAIGYWKRATTFLARGQGVIGRVWQRSMYDRGVRDDGDLRATATYVVNNPVRAGLVEVWSEYAPLAWNVWTGDSPAL